MYLSNIKLQLSKQCEGAQQGKSEYSYMYVRISVKPAQFFFLVIQKSCPFVFKYGDTQVSANTNIMHV